VREWNELTPDIQNLTHAEFEFNAKLLAKCELISLIASTK